MAAAALLVAPLTGLLVQRIGARPPLAVGTVLTAVAIIGLALGGTGLFIAMAWMTLAGTGIAMVLVAAVTAISAATADPLAGVLGGLYQTVVTAGAVLGSALLSDLLNAQVKHQTSGPSPLAVNTLHQTYTSALHTTLWTAAAVVLISAAFSAFARPAQSPVSANLPPS